MNNLKEKKLLQNNALENLRQLVGNDLQKVDDIAYSLIKSKVDMVADIAKYTIAAGGKRIRPMLTIACSKMCDVKSDSYIDLATSVEFFHTATLLHDDVVDESFMRRGEATANDVWGNKESVLVGDYLLGKAFELMGSAKSLDVYKILSKASVVIAEGEVLQLIIVGDIECGIDKYLQVINSKTAALFAAACEIAPMMANSNKLHAKALKDFGANLGMAYQIIDDALDYQQLENNNIGKEIGDDFKERKITLPILLAYQNADDNQKKFWKRTINEGIQNSTDLQQAISYLNNPQINNAIKDYAINFASKAKSSLKIFPDSEYKTALTDLVDFVVFRNY